MLDSYFILCHKCNSPHCSVGSQVYSLAGVKVTLTSLIHQFWDTATKTFDDILLINNILLYLLTLQTTFEYEHCHYVWLSKSMNIIVKLV